MNKFLICDLGAIETRVSAYLTQCPGLMEVFRLNRDPYLDLASKMYNILYEVLQQDLKGTDKEKKALAKFYRQMAKPGILGAVYRLGGGGWGRNKYGDRIKTGLWGYAQNMGVNMTQEMAHKIVRMFREAYPEIPRFWKTLEINVREVLNPEVKNVKRYLGPVGGQVQMSKINIDGRYPLFRMRLPSGRMLHYLDARMEETLMPWKDKQGEDVYRPALWYGGQDQVTKKWVSITSHGGKIMENLVQGIARDVLAEKLILFQENDMDVVGHWHDEGAAVVPDDIFSPKVDKMIELMSLPVSWAPGLILGADGMESPYYRK